MRSTILTGAATVVLCCLVATTPHADELSERVDAYMKAATERGEFSGSILIGRKGKVLVSKGYGLANREHDVPNSPRTKFRIGSITKQFTAMAIMQLRGRGKLDVGDPIGKHIADAPKAWEKVTVHHLLTHTSGVPSYTGFPGFRASSMIPMSLSRLIGTFKDKPLQFEPGLRFRYSNSGYVLLGAIIEKVAGMTYEAFLRKNVFGPLEMKDSGYDRHKSILPHRATGYAKRDGRIVNSAPIHMSLPHAAGALYSTVADLHRWDRALYGEKLLPAKARTLMFTPFKSGYAYGWGVRKVASRTVIGHSGGINGFVSRISRYPAEQLVVIVLSNLERSQVRRIATDLAAAALGEKLPKQGQGGKR